MVPKSRVTKLPTGKPYTVVLLRPPYLCERTGDAFGEDLYAATVCAVDPAAAVSLARLEVFAADRLDGFAPEAPRDYRLGVVFDGHHTPVRWGWQE